MSSTHPIYLLQVIFILRYCSWATFCKSKQVYLDIHLYPFLKCSILSILFCKLLKDKSGNHINSQRSSLFFMPVKHSIVGPYKRLVCLYPEDWYLCCFTSTKSSNRHLQWSEGHCLPVEMQWEGWDIICE